MKNNALKMLKWLGIILLFFILTILSLNIYIVGSNKSRIYNLENVSLENIDAILVLGAGIRGKNPSPMLEDRLKAAISLYEKNNNIKMIMSGDHKRDDYNEVQVMKNYAIKNGVPSEHVFMDHAGFSSYESLYRAKEIFGVKKIVIVTQKYHLYRALYIAKKLGLEAYGVASNPRNYAGQTKREIRESLARIKDFFKCILKPEPTYLGKAISLSASGDLTND
ncbi:MAG: DUF218 domain-containing protein [Bacilli bacterium]|nr:DUF218 domain-containing protein [Bacilli bacterium]